MRFKELKALPQPELREKMLELKKELMKENAQVAIGTVPKNPRKLRIAKKTIARIETILSQDRTNKGKPSDQRSKISSDGTSASERGPADKRSEVGAAKPAQPATKPAEAPQK